MTALVRVTPAAEIDLAVTFAWYEDQRQGLGIEFVIAADELLQRIRESPRMFPEVSGGLRRALLHRFPYGIYFVHEQGRSTVLAVLHLHRDPGVWQSRFRVGTE